MYIFNLCLFSGVFPDYFKHSIIHPIHKSDSRDCVENYRPISVLTALSKIFEKLLNSRLMNFLIQENILSDSQFGFQPKKSTQDAVTRLTNHIVSHVDQKKKCIGTFLDLTKAFDTVSTEILLQKLEATGIREFPFNCLSYQLYIRVTCLTEPNLLKLKIK